jgi:hypothetical protein
VDTEIYIEDARRVTAAVSASVDVVQIVGTVIWEAASTEVELGLALLVNDDERIAMLGAEHQAIIDIAAEVIDEIWREIDALDDYEKGRLMGLVAGTIAIEFVTVAASAGTGAVLKSTVLARALPKLRARPPVQRHNDVVAAIDRVTGLVADIATTRMCFARGTLVHSSDGLRPIEEIRRGDAVLSRDPGTGRTGWKPVRNVFATSPDALLRLSVSKQAATGRAQRERVLSAQASQEARTDREPAPRVRTTAPDATEDILSTHSHPFCSVSRDDFVLAGEVRIGEELFLAGASTAFVTDIQVERGPPSNGGGHGRRTILKSTTGTPTSSMSSA